MNCPVEFSNGNSERGTIEMAYVFAIVRNLLPTTPAHNWIKISQQLQTSFVKNKVGFKCYFENSYYGLHKQRIIGTFFQLISAQAFKCMAIILCLLEWNHFGYQATCQPQFSRVLQMHIPSWREKGQASQRRPERPVLMHRCTCGKAIMQLLASSERSALGTGVTQIWMMAQEEPRGGERIWGAEERGLKILNNPAIRRGPHSSPRPHTIS